MSAADDRPLAGQLALAGTGVSDAPPRVVTAPPALLDDQGRPLVTVLRGQTVEPGWPEKTGDDGRPKRAIEILRAPLSGALAWEWPCDAHVTQYVAPHIDVQTAHGMRPASKLRLAGGAESKIPGGYHMHLFVVDVDGPIHRHKAEIRSAKRALDSGHLAAGVAALEALTPQVRIEHEVWWQAERQKIERVYRDHNPCVYRTGGGYRLLGWIDRPFSIASPADRVAWSHQYLTWLGYLSITYGIVGDAACAYPECLFRLPFVVRDGNPQTPELIGDPSDAFWCLDCECDDEAALAEARRLWPSRIDGASRSGGGRDHVTYEPEEIAKRWDAFSDDEQERRIALYVADLKTGLEPSGIDGRATRLIAARSGVIGFGIGDLDLVMDLMIEHWVPRCDQKWSRSDLVHKVEDAAKSDKEIDFNLPEIVAQRVAEETSRMFSNLLGSAPSPLTPVPAPPAPSLSPPTPALAPGSRIDRIRAMLDTPKPKLTLEEARAKIAKALREA
ncbi:MAG: hypothetical protein ACHQCG_01440 [Solirubrobacterales bacterium]